MKKIKESQELIKSSPIFIFFFGIFFFSCTLQLKPDKVNSIRILYLPEEMTVMTSIDTCDKIFIYPEFLKDTTIIDQKFINDFTREFNSLEKSNEIDSAIDFRIRCILDYENDKNYIICLGEYFDIMVDNSLMKDNPELIQLIKSYIYF